MAEPRIDRARRRMAHWLAGVPLPMEGLFQRRRESLFAAQIGVRMFYAVALYQVCDAASLQRFLDAPALDPLWCVRWARMTGPALAGSIVYAASLLSAIACVLA